MHRREHVVILRPSQRGIMLHTMYYVDEIRNVEEFTPHTNLVIEKELKLAKTLIESLVTHFHPEKYKDTYRENLKKIIAAKAKGKEGRAEPKPAKIVDIMEALKKSLSEMKEQRPRRASAKKATRRKRAA